MSKELFILREMFDFLADVKFLSHSSILEISCSYPNMTPKNKAVLT